MKLTDVHKGISDLLYFEDYGAVDIVLASSIATRLKLGNPVWLILIGVSSSGKSQIIRPLYSKDDSFIKRVDDLTDSTLISGYNSGKDKADTISLLNKSWTHGMLLISDLTTIFSKSPESREAILGQLRLVYDGEFTKYFGNQEPKTWKGFLGIIAGCTPSVYRHFEYIADMGERFIYYRMKHSDPLKSVTKAFDNTLYGSDLDDKISDIYLDYLQDVIKSQPEVPRLPKKVKDRIINVSLFAAQMRTPIHLDPRRSEIDRIPFSEMPMRVALQLMTLAKAYMVMHHHDTGEWDLSEDQIKNIEWCAYSLANEERRACLKVMASTGYGDHISSSNLAHIVGLSTDMIKIHAQILSAIGIVERTKKDNGSLLWRIKDKAQYNYVRSLEGITGVSDDGISDQDDDWDSF